MHRADVHIRSFYYSIRAARGEKRTIIIYICNIRLTKATKARVFRHAGSSISSRPNSLSSPLYACVMYIYNMGIILFLAAAIKKELMALFIAWRLFRARQHKKLLLLTQITCL
jgi:hypothetical protein